MFLAEDWVLVLIGTLFIGLGMSAFWPAIFGFIGDVNIDRVGESSGRVFLFSDIGSIFSSLFAFFLLQQLKFSLKGLFGAVTLISLFTGIVSWILLPESLVKKDRKQVDNVRKAIFKEWKSMITSLRKLSSINKLWQVYFFHFIIAFTEFAASFFVPLIIVSKGFTNADVSAIMLWTLILIFWLKPYLGSLTDRIDFTTVATVSTIISCIVFIAYIFANDFIFLVGVYWVGNAATMMAYFAANGETTRRAPIADRGIALGVFGVYVSIGRTASTVVLGPVWELFELTGVFIFAPILILILTILLYLKIKRNSDSTVTNLL
jgi:predicted MFS family arabinose efflux permease